MWRFPAPDSRFPIFRNGGSAAPEYSLRSTKLDKKYSAEDVLKLTKNIYRVDTGDGEGAKVSAIQKRTQVLLDTLGVELLRKN